MATALHNSGLYRVRAVTHNLHDVGTKKLKREAEGCEVVEMDWRNKQGLRNVLAGSQGVFLVTSFWRVIMNLDNNSDTEAQDVLVAYEKAVADTCKMLGVKVLIYSGQEHVGDVFGKPCPLMDAKGIMEKYLEHIDIPHVIIRAAYLFSNFLMRLFSPNDDGSYTLYMPIRGPFFSMCDENIGQAVLSILDGRDKYLGKTIGLCSDWMTMEEHVQIISDVTGKEIYYEPVSAEVFEASFDSPALDNVATMFEFFEKGNPDRDIILTRALCRDVLDFKTWAEKHKDDFCIF